MADCPVCRRSFDDRFSVFVPPRAEPFDTIECARRAARTADGAGDATPLILPTIDVLTSLGPQAKAVQARDPAMGAALRRRAPVPIAVVVGLSLVAVGTASSLYVWSGLPQYGLEATRTAAPHTEPSAASADAAIPPAPQAPSTRDVGRLAAEPVAPTSSQLAGSSEPAVASSSLVESAAASPPSEPPPPPPTPATKPSEPPSQSNSPPNRPQPSPEPPSQPAPPPAPNPPPPNRPQPSPQPPTGGATLYEAGAGHVWSTPSTAPPPAPPADDEGAKPKKPKKPKKHKKPNEPPADSQPAPPSGAVPAVPATPAQPPAHTEDEDGQRGASESQGSRDGSQGNGNGNGNSNGNGSSNGKKP